MTIGSFFLPDLTGSLTAYQMEDTVVFFREKQTITFPVPVFADTLTLMTTTATPAEVGYDYVIDDGAMSVALSVDPSFSRDLITSVTINAPFNSRAVIKVAAQGFYASKTLSPISDGDVVVNLTPSLVAKMLYDINTLQTLMSQGVSATLSEAYGAPTLLDIDLTGTATANKVSDEYHDIDTFQKKNLIIPQCGSFYRTGLSIKKNGASIALVEGTDYVLTGLNTGKTTDTSSSSAVYDGILIISPYAGTVSLEYQAFGGGVSRNDITSLTASVTNILDYLSTRQFLTVSGLNSTELATTLNSRVVTLETNMRALMTTPRYADSTSNATIVRKFQSNDTDFHWWSIAKLYKVTGSDDIFTQAMGSYRISIPQLNLQFKVEVGINLAATEPLSVLTSIYSGNIDPTSGTVFIPRLRLIFDTLTGGAFLQLGLRLSTVIVTSLAIEDCGGTETSLLMLSDSNATSPEDDDITLPDGVSIWSDNNVGYGTIAPRDGYRFLTVKDGSPQIYNQDIRFGDVASVTVYSEADAMYRPAGFSVSGDQITIEGYGIFTTDSVVSLTATTNGSVYLHF